MSPQVLMCMLVLVISGVCFLAIEWPDQDPSIVFCNVGQGDAILIIDGFSQALIDAGPDDKVMQCLEKYLPFWDKTLELLVLTHPDSDHLGGMAAVLGQYQPQYILTDLSGKQTAQYQRVFEAFKLAVQKGASITFPRVGKQLWLGRLSLGVWQAPQAQERIARLTETVLWDRTQQEGVVFEGENSDSIVLFGQLGNARFLLTGDLEAEGELALSVYKLTTKINLLKAGHHGSKTSSQPLFIEKVVPEKVIISSGKNNRYGHPAPEVLATLGKSGAQIFRTDQLGDIVFVSNGKTWTQKTTLVERLRKLFLLKGDLLNFVIVPKNVQVAKE
jgi:competence protein ComEC